MVTVGIKQRFVEFKGKTLVTVANRTFKTNPTFVDRVCFKAAELLFGKSRDLDESFAHDER